MPGTRKTSAGKPPAQAPEDDKYRVVLIAPDRDALGRLLQKYDLDVGPLEQRRDSKEIEAHIFATQAQIELLRREKWRLEVHENLSEIGRERQKEVARGDRFEGGKVAPKGLGKKSNREG